MTLTLGTPRGRIRPRKSSAAPRSSLVRHVPPAIPAHPSLFYAAISARRCRCPGRRTRRRQRLRVLHLRWQVCGDEVADFFLEGALFGTEGESMLRSAQVCTGRRPTRRGGDSDGRCRRTGIEGEQPLEVGADVEFFGDAHGAVKLDRLLGDEARAFPILALAPDAARPRATGSASAISAARSAIDRASSHCIAMSASRWRITWLAASGRRIACGFWYSRASCRA